ncbi:hypothetical protein [Pedobacter sp. N23S346]
MNIKNIKGLSEDEISVVAIYNIPEHKESLAHSSNPKTADTI